MGLQSFAFVSTLLICASTAVEVPVLSLTFPTTSRPGTGTASGSGAIPSNSVPTGIYTNSTRTPSVSPSVSPSNGFSGSITPLTPILTPPSLTPPSVSPTLSLPVNDTSITPSVTPSIPTTSISITPSVSGSPSVPVESPPLSDSVTPSESGAPSVPVESPTSGGSVTPTVSGTSSVPTESPTSGTGTEPTTGSTETTVPALTSPTPTSPASSISIPSGSESTAASGTETGSTTTSVFESASGSASGSPVATTSETGATSSPEATGSLTGSSIAPTSAPSGSLATTGTSPSSFTTSTLSGSAATPSSSTGPSIFFSLRVFFSDGRQGGLTVTGEISLDISLFGTFQIVAGELFQIAGGQRVRRALGGLISTNPGAERQALTPLDPQGSITTDFIFTGIGQELPWSNSAFFSGGARYCVIGTTVYATFVENTSFCDYTTQVIIGEPINAGASGTVGGPSATGSGGVSPGQSGTPGSTTIINNYDTTTVINNAVYNINIDINVLGLGGVFVNNNYCSNDAETFYAKLCPVCQPVKVFTANLTFAETPCPVCPAELYKLSSISGQPSAGSGNCSYGAVSCVSCNQKSAPPPAVAKDLAVVPAPCPVCPGKSTALVCPAASSSAIASLVAASGVPAAASAASQALASYPAATITKQVTVTQQSVQTVLANSNTPTPSSTVVNLACPSCPAGSAPATLPQVVQPVATVAADAKAAVAPTVKPAVQPYSNATAPIAAFKGEAASSSSLPAVMILLMTGGLTALFFQIM